MTRKAKALTLAQVKKLPQGAHAVGGPVLGLVVHVGANGRRWKLRRTVDGTQRVFDLGAWQDLPTLAAAQAMATALADSLAVDAQAAASKRKSRGPAAKPAPVVEVAEASAGDNPFLGPIGRELIAQ